MKIFENKNILKKILLVLVIIILFEFSIPNTVSNAKDESGWGGTLFLPIQSLTLALGDVCEVILNLSTGNNIQPVLTLSKTMSNSSTVVHFLLGITGSTIPALQFDAVDKAARGISKAVYKFTDEDFVDEIQLPVMTVTPDKIFNNEIPLLDVNIINPKTYTDSDGNKIDTPVSILQSTISTWYKVLRDIAIVAFLSILVYVGIRIVISSAAEDKSKYKQMLNDWIVGLCLLFVMHYIMSFAITMVEKITDFVDIGGEEIVIESDDVNLSEFNTEDSTVQEIIKVYNNDETEKLNWSTDLAGYIRFNAQTNINSNSVAVQMAYTIMYIVLVFYTIMFFIQYLKRLFNIVLLTLVSPIVAFAYPIDKLSDGKAQAFNMWIKEYLFNLLLQPMHLILYSVLMGSAMNLVTDYPLYGIIVLGCLLQVEKLFRKILGFERAGTTDSAASGAFTGAVVMQGINSIVNKAKHSDNARGSKGTSGGKIDSSNSKVRTIDNRSVDEPDKEDEFMMNALSGNDNNTEYSQDVEKLNPGSGKQNKTNTEEQLGENPQNQYLEGQQNEAIRVKDNNTSQNNQEAIRQNETNLNIDKVNNPIDNKIDYGKKNKKKIGKFKKAGAIVRMTVPKAGKAILKGSAMAVGAGTLGMIGVAGGLASDNSMNVLKYGAAGLSGGALVGNVAANGVLNGVSKGPSSISQKVQAKRDEIAREAYKDDPKGYKQYLNEQADKQFLRDKEIRQQYANAFGDKEATTMMQNAIAYRQHGITDNEVIIKAMKETSGDIGKTDVTDNRRIAAAKLASGISNSKDIENMTKRLQKQGYKDDIIDQNEEFIRSIKGLKYN